MQLDFFKDLNSIRSKGSIKKNEQYDEWFDQDELNEIKNYFGFHKTRGQQQSLKQVRQHDMDIGGGNRFAFNSNQINQRLKTAAKSKLSKDLEEFTKRNKGAMGGGVYGDV